MPPHSKSEYRVRWQRVGLPKRIKLYQTREAAERFVQTLRGDFKGAMLEAEDYDSARDFYERIPALTWGPIIEARPVGDWGVE